MSDNGSVGEGSDVCTSEDDGERSADVVSELQSFGSEYTSLCSAVDNLESVLGHLESQSDALYDEVKAFLDESRQQRAQHTEVGEGGDDCDPKPTEEKQEEGQPVHE